MTPPVSLRQFYCNSFAAGWPTCLNYFIFYFQIGWSTSVFILFLSYILSSYSYKYTWMHLGWMETRAENGRGCRFIQFHVQMEQTDFPDGWDQMAASCYLIYRCWIHQDQTQSFKTVLFKGRGKEMHSVVNLLGIHAGFKNEPDGYIINDVLNHWRLQVRRETLIQPCRSRLIGLVQSRDAETCDLSVWWNENADSGCVK